jgi:Fe-S cluster assembly protein SufD
MNDSAPYVEALSRICVPEWLDEKRHSALTRFLSNGLPQSRQEAWKYTSLERLERSSMHAPAQSDGEMVCVDLEAYPGQVLDFDNGRLACHGTQLSRSWAGSLACFGDSRLVQDCLGRLTGDSILASLNLALWQDGALIHVPSGTSVRIPIFAVYGASEADAMIHPRSLAVLEHDSRAVLVEHFIGNTPHACWQNAVTEIMLEPGSRLTHIRVVEEGENATHTGLTRVSMARDSRYDVLHVGLSGGLVRHDLTVDMAGPGTRARVDGLDLTGGRRHTDLHLHIHHQERQTTSRVNWLGIANGRGHAIFDGHVMVAHDAHKTDARQSCRGLLVSPHAEVDAMPRLEIYADDVKCSHGASIGSLDKDALFYLESRGIEPAMARRLLLRGFAAGALGLLEQSGLKEWFAPRLDAAFDRTLAIQERKETEA